MHDFRGWFIFWSAILVRRLWTQIYVFSDDGNKSAILYKNLCAEIQVGLSSLTYQNILNILLVYYISSIMTYVMSWRRAA